MSRRAFVWRTASGAVAVGGLAGFLEACGGSSTDTHAADPFRDAKPPARPIGSFRRSYGLEIDTLDPAVSVAGGLLFIANIYEGLVRYDDAWKRIVPNLATAWTSSDDGLEWSLDLRQGVHFHDGEPFDSRSIKATFDYFKRKGSLASTLLPAFREIDVRDPAKVRFALKEPAGDFLRNQSWLRIMSPKLIAAGEKEIGRRPSGTGAYKFASRTPGRSVTLAVNPEYWGPGPYFEELTWLLMPDASTRVNALRSRQIDQTNSLSPEILPQLTGNSSLEVLERPGWRISYLHMTVTNPNVSDKRVRQAIAYAIDRKAIVQRLLDGKGTVATSVVPAAVYGHIDASPQYDYDPDRARALLREVGSSSGHPIRMVVFPEATVRGKDVSDAIVGQLKDAGFDATLDVSDATVVAAEVGKKRPKWDLYYNEHSWLTGGAVIFSIELIQQLSRFNPTKLQQLNSRQKAMPDGPERLKVLADMQNLVQEEAPYIGLWVANQIDAEKADVQAYTPPPDAISYRYASVFRAQPARS